MTQIPDAPWIKDAEIDGYPVSDDADDIEIDIFPTMPKWLWED